MSKREVQARPESDAATGSPVAVESMENLQRQAEILCNSDLVPSSYKGKPNNAIAAIIMGRELGLSTMQSLRSIMVVNGVPSVWGDALLALVQKSPNYEWHEETIAGEGMARTATCKMKRRGNPNPITATFSMGQAKTAGLLHKDPWKKYPDRMIQMRSRSFCIRDTFADALGGFIAREEADDYETADVVSEGAQEAPAKTGMKGLRNKLGLVSGSEVEAPAEPAAPVSSAAPPTPDSSTSKLEKSWKSAVFMFNDQYGVSEEQLLDFLHLTMANQVTKDHVLTLRSVYKDILAKQITAVEVFGHEPTNTPPADTEPDKVEEPDEAPAVKSTVTMPEGAEDAFPKE